MTDDEMLGLGLMALGGGMIFIFVLVLLIILIFFLLSMNKAAMSIRTNNPPTYVSRVWVWTQLIPIWNLVAFIVFHIKMNNALRAFEAEHGLEINHINYPNVSGWFFALGILYSWVPFIGAIVYFVMWIIYWVKISGVSSRAFAIKYGKQQAQNQQTS